MTLCIAASCAVKKAEEQVREARIVFCSDRRVETDIASADTGTKFTILTDRFWVMFADNISRARDFISTCHESLDNAALDPDEISDKLAAASIAYKKKLIERKAQLEFGMSYERILTEGEHELPADERRLFFHEITRLTYDCELLVFGFSRRESAMGPSHFSPYIFCIDRYGEVSNEGSFAAIGSGGTVAEGNLFFREQHELESVERTLYNVYESSKIAYEAKAPGVGETGTYRIIQPGETGLLIKMTNEKGLLALKKLRTKYGARPIKNIGKFDDGHFKKMGEFVVRGRVSKEGK
jgi:20S proteasome alpha/beta subunit